jgi:hypothetical protein
MTIPAMRLGWELSLPEKYRLVRHDGSLRHVDYLDRELAGLTRTGVPTQRAQPLVAKTPQVLPNYNVRAQDNLQQIAGAVVKGRARGQRSIYTGTKPETRNVYYFQSLIAMKEPGDIRSTYLRTSVDHVAQGVLVVASVAAVLAFWSLCRRWSRLWRLAVLISLVLIILGARTLSEEAYRQHITDVLWAVALTSIAMVLWDGVRGAGNRLRKPPTGEGEQPPEERATKEHPAAPEND